MNSHLTQWRIEKERRLRWQLFDFLYDFRERVRIRHSTWNFIWNRVSEVVAERTWTFPVDQMFEEIKDRV